jgi:two-component system, NarL family, invasion response regulator UvrY
MSKSTKIAIVDDHKLFRSGMIRFLKSIYSEVEFVFEVANGREMVEMLQALAKENIPEILILDIHMPEMDGFESAEWLKAYYPGIKILVLSMSDKESDILRMLRLGAKGYMSKSAEAEEFKDAIIALRSRGCYYSDFVTGKLLNVIESESKNECEGRVNIEFSEKELQFISLSATELTYNEIAEKMSLSPRTVDGYRNNLYEKCQVKSRVGLALFALKQSLITV